MESVMRGEFILLIDAETSGRIYCANDNRVERFISAADVLMKLRRFMRSIQLPEPEAPGVPLLTPGKITGLRLIIYGIADNNIKGFALIDGKRTLINSDENLFSLMTREIQAAKTRMRTADNVARFRERSLMRSK